MLLDQLLGFEASSFLFLFLLHLIHFLMLLKDAEITQIAQEFTDKRVRLCLIVLGYLAKWISCILQQLVNVLLILKFHLRHYLLRVALEVRLQLEWLLRLTE